MSPCSCSWFSGIELYDEVGTQILIDQIYAVPDSVNVLNQVYSLNILLTKTTASRNEAALSYQKEGLYFLVVIFAATIVFCKDIAMYSNSVENYITNNIHSSDDIMCGKF